MAGASCFLEGGAIWWGGEWGRKDGFPGADGSTITQEINNNAQTIPMYGATGNELAEGSKEGLQLIDVTTSGVIGNNNTSFTYAIKHPLTFIYNISYDICYILHK